MRRVFSEFFSSHLFIITALITLKMILLRYLLFEKFDIGGTFLLDFSYILIFTSLMAFLIYERIAPIAFLLLNLFFSLLFLSIVLYHSYFNQIVTYHALKQWNQLDTIRDSIFAIMEPIYGLFFLDIVVLIFLIMIRKYPIKQVHINKWKVVLPIFILSIVASYTNYMIHKDHSINSNIIAAQRKGILNYEVIEILAADSEEDKSLNRKLESENSIQASIRRLKELDYLPPEKRNYFGLAEGRHLIVIQVESMQSLPIGLKIDGKEVTPNFNKLIKEGFYFPNTYQQTGPGNTSDAEFIMNTSLFPVANTPTSDTYGDRRFPSLPRILQGYGYQTMTFHADEIDFWNRKELYPALGFETYFDENFFENEDIIGLGPSDQVLYNKALPVLKKLHDKNQPFYAQLVGLTSHHPFKMPEEKVRLELPQKYDGTLTGDYFKIIHYEDQVIGEFIQKLKDEGIYDKSVVLIYGDHVGLAEHIMDEKDTQLVEDLIGYEYKNMDRLKLPFIVLAPGISNGKTYDNTVGQLDFMPTVANLLGVSLDDAVIFGQDVLNHNENLVGVRYYLPTGSFFTNDILFTPQVGYEDGIAYDLKTRAVIKDLGRYNENYDSIIQLEKLSDSYMKKLPKRNMDISKNNK